MRAALAGLLLLASGCAGARASALLRVDPPPPERGAALDVSEGRVERAVRDAVASERLACTPGGGVLLSCRPEDVGTRSGFLTVSVARAGAGYEVSVDEVLPSFRRGPPAACALRRRVARALELEFGMPVAREIDSPACPAGR